MRRFHFPIIPSIGSSFFVPDDQITHLARVLRVQKDDIIEASDGSGYVFTLCVIHVESNAIQLRVVASQKGDEVALQSVAFISELKNDAMDQSISILAEHGIQRIVPFFSSRSIPKFDQKQAHKKQERRQKLANETIKKVGGLYSCEVEPSLSFKNIQQMLNNIPQKIIFWEKENAPSHHLNTIDYSQSHAFIIGPEGGFTESEIDLLLSWGCQCYSLGSRILRAPQATSAAATIIRYLTENSL